MSFDPSKLSQPQPSSQRRGPRSERLFVEVAQYETPADGFHFAVGQRMDTGEQVRVRLNTVAERVQDKPGSNPEAVKTLYISGENTRDSLSDKSKNGVKLLSFDDAKKLGEVEGVAEYRAHWPKTMATDPGAEVRVGMMSVRLRDAAEINGEHQKAVARVDQLQWSVNATRENIDAALSNALAIKDAEGRARDPFVQVRVMHEGNVVQQVRLYPETAVTKLFDQDTGEHKDVRRPVDADKTIASLLSGAQGWSEQDNQRKDVLRALVAGIKGMDEPPFHAPDDGLRARARNLYYGAQQGALTVEITAGEGIDFGAKARQTYLAQKDRAPMKSYLIEESLGEGEAKHVKQTPGYTMTAIAINRHEDGEPYAVFASPTEMFPKVAKLEALPNLPAAERAFDLEAKKEVEKASEAAFEM